MNMKQALKIEAGKGDRIGVVCGLSYGVLCGVAVAVASRLPVFVRAARGRHWRARRPSP